MNTAPSLQAALQKEAKRMVAVANHNKLPHVSCKKNTFYCIIMNVNNEYGFCLYSQLSN